MNLSHRDIIETHTEGTAGDDVAYADVVQTHCHFVFHCAYSLQVEVKGVKGCFYFQFAARLMM